MEVVLKSTWHLAAVLLVSQAEFDVGVAQAIVVHGDEVATLNEGDVDDPSPQLGLPVDLRETGRLLLLSLQK